MKHWCILIACLFLAAGCDSSEVIATQTATAATAIAAAWTPTSTNTPTATPTPTNTPTPTPTPTPTVTLTPTPTPICPVIPKQLINVNPPQNISNREEAEKAYFSEVQASTQRYPIRNAALHWYPIIGVETADFDIYLTYLSPQLIVSAVHRESIRRDYDEEQETNLLREVNERLLAQNSIVFVFYVTSNKPNAKIDLSPFKDSVLMKTTRGQEIRPTQYEPLFDNPLDMRSGSHWGYIFFPLSAGCSNGQLINAIDLNQEPSISMRITNVRFSYEDFVPEFKTNLAWNFNLVPIDLSLEQALGIPEKTVDPMAPSPVPPDSSRPNATLADLSSIATVVGTVITVIGRLIPPV
jgi:hypothetical protein